MSSSESSKTSASPSPGSVTLPKIEEREKKPNPWKLTDEEAERVERSSRRLRELEK